MSKKYFRITVTVDIAAEDFEWWCYGDDKIEDLKPEDVIEMIRDDGLDRVLEIDEEIENFVDVEEWYE